MSPQEFIENLALELEFRNHLYSTGNEIKTEVASRIKNLCLSESQEAELKKFFS